MGIWVLAIGTAAFLLTLTATAAAVLSRSESKLLFRIPMFIWWLCATAVCTAIAAWTWKLTHEEHAYPDYFPHALLLAAAAIAGIPILAARARMRLFGRPDAQTWPILPLLGVSFVLLIASVVTYAEIDGSAQIMARMGRPQLDSAYLKLVGPEPAGSDNAAELYRQAIAFCQQEISAADAAAETGAIPAATAPATQQGLATTQPSRLLGSAAQATSPQVVALLGRLHPGLQATRVAAAKPVCRMQPITGAPAAVDRLSPDLSGFRTLAAALASNAVLAARNGRPGDAMLDLVVLRRLEMHVQQSERSVVPVLVSIQIGMLTNETIAAVLPALRAMPEHAEALVRDEDATRADLSAGLRGEELGINGILLAASEGKVALNGMPPRLYRMLFLGSDAAGLRAWFQSLVAPLDGKQREGSWDERGRSMLSPYAQRFVTILPKVTDTVYPEYLATSRSAAVCIALTRHRLEKGAYPAALDELVPQYIAAVPADPFDQQPLRYRVEGGMAVVYSVGPDRKDDAGKVRPGDAPPAEGRDVGLELIALPNP